MPTFTLTGFQVDSDADGTAVDVFPLTFDLLVSEGDESFRYTVTNPGIGGQLPEIDLEGGDIGVIAAGDGVPGGRAPLFDEDVIRLGDVTFDSGETSTLLVVGVRNDDGSYSEGIFQVGGDPLDYPSDVTEWQALEDSVESVSVASGTLAPDTDISFASFSNTTQDVAPENVLVGSLFGDSLIGTDQNDYVLPGDNAGGGQGFDYIAGSRGDDTMDFSGIEDGFVTLDYSRLDGGTPIAVSIDGVSNTGEVDKGTLGTDTLIDVENPMAFTPVNGLSVVGTAEDDTYDINVTGDQWVIVASQDGEDELTFNGDGYLRLDFSIAEQGTDVNLATKVIEDDGFGNRETIGGTGTPWEVEGSYFFGDRFTGSGADESFRGGGGDDTLDGGDGVDLLRYDSAVTNTVRIDASAGTATGLIFNGTRFTDQISGFERLSGTSGNDKFVGAADTDNEFEGSFGPTSFSDADVFVHTGGNDSIVSFDVSRDTLVIDVDGLTRSQIETAVGNAASVDDGVRVDLGSGSVVLGGVTVADLGTANIQTNAGLNVVPGTDGNDTLTGTAGDDLLVTGDNDGGIEGYDLVEASDGDDTIDMTDVVTGYVVLDYSGYGTPVTFSLDVEANTGTVDKGANGTDTLRGVVSPLEAWNGGLELRGTQGDDVFDVELAQFSAGVEGSQWISLRGGDGTDTYDLGGSFAASVRYVRLDFRDATEGIDVDLALPIDQIANDGFGNTESITGSTGNISEVQGSANDDLFSGSSRNVTFRDFGGDDTLDGGSGYDRLRYDRDEVASVDIDVAAGTATGDLAGGGSFTDQISGFENFRGSYGDDRIELASNMMGVSAAEGAAGDDTLIGSTNDDTLDGGDGNDEIRLVGADGGTGSDEVRGSRGDDTIDFSASDQDFVQLDYSGVETALSVDIDGSANTGSVDKGDAGTDTLVDVATPLSAGWTTGGLGIRGTVEDDTFNLAPGDEQWMTVVGDEGTDSYTIDGSGLVRLDFRNTGPVDIDLSRATGQIINDGFGNTETIGGSSDVWEIYGTFGSDRFVGSDADESWRSDVGNDTLDGGGGFDRLRYDSSDNFSNAGIDIDAVAGTATDRADPEAADTISNFEWFRGSDNDDRIAGDSSDNRLEGMAGNDTLIGRGGDDTFHGGAGEDAFVIGTGVNVIEDFQIGVDTFDVVIDGLTDAERDAFLGRGETVTGGGGTIVDFGGGNTLTFEGLTPAEVGSLSPAPPPPPTTPIAWTTGDPHLLTIDGVGYDFHAIGEFVLLRGVEDGAFPDFEIQSRMGDVVDSEGNTVPNVSANVAIATRLADGSEVMIDSTDASPLSIDGTPETVSDGGVLDVGNDRIFRDGDTYTIVFAGEDDAVGAGDARLSVIVRDGRLDMGVQLSEAMAGEVEGLLGDGDGNPDNDIARADGTVLERPLAFDELYGDYRDDWRVDSEGESLFTYDSGESLDGFYDPDAPGEVPGIADFDTAEVDDARSAVADAGLEPGTIAFDNAVLDFLLTNDEEFIESSSQETAPETSSSGSAGTLDQGETRITIDVALSDEGGDALEGAVVNFSTGGAPILGRTGDQPGDYEIRLGSNTPDGRVDAVKDYEEGDADIGVGDALDVLRMAVGLDPSFGPAAPENFIAGDVDGSGDVSVSDALDVLRFAVGLETENAPRWVFLDPDSDLSGIDADNVDYETGTDTSAIADGLDIELSGVLLGDLSARPEA